jgi:hypothetical protein
MTKRSSIEKDVPTLLPDGTPFQIWRDETDYRKVYYVDQQHHEAADDNPGTEEAPFVTIQAAAEVVGAGEKVLIKSGIYRELVQPRQGGTGTDGMISFEAAPGADATIRGSQVLSTWTGSDVARSVSVWMTELPEAFFEGEHPFAVVCTTEEEFEKMPWAHAELGRVPHTLPRAMAFQDGRRLIQLGTHDELPRVAGTFWIDTEHRKLHVNPFDRADLNTCQMEATTQQFLFQPGVAGLGYIRLKGLTFEHAGNGFMCYGNGAVTTWGGHHWIIEDNIIGQINSVGLDIGARTDRESDSIGEEEARIGTGDHLVLRNEIHDCGTGGIQGHVISRTLIADNHIHHCGWQEIERYWHTGAIKTVYTADCLLQGNHFHDIHAAPAIWIDVWNWNTRICRNLVHDIAVTSGAIFPEKSNFLCLIDHNIIYNVIGGSGIFPQDIDQVLIAHNLILNCSLPGIRMSKNPRRDRVGICKHNRITNNIIAQCPVGFEYAKENVSDYNIFSRMGDDFSLDDWQANGQDTHSTTMELDIAIGDDQGLEWSSPTDAVLMVGREELLDLDYFGRPYTQDEVTVGPFIEGWSAVRRRLRLDTRLPKD